MHFGVESTIYYLEPEDELQKLLILLGFSKENANPKLALTVGSPNLLRLLGQHLIFKDLDGAGMIEQVFKFEDQDPYWGAIRLKKQSIGISDCRSGSPTSLNSLNSF